MADEFDDTPTGDRFFSAKVPLSFVIVVSIILGAILGWFFGFMRRRRKRSRID